MQNPEQEFDFTQLQTKYANEVVWAVMLDAESEVLATGQVETGEHGYVLFTVRTLGKPGSVANSTAIKVFAFSPRKITKAEWCTAGSHWHVHLLA